MNADYLSLQELSFELKLCSPPLQLGNEDTKENTGNWAWRKIPVITEEILNKYSLIL